jgi:polyferredoxin
MECITCALCIDACDGVMDKLGREQGLIAYSTLKDYSLNMGLATAGNTKPIEPARVRTAEGGLRPEILRFNWRVIFRPRIVVYSVLWGLVGAGLLVGLAMRERLQLDVLHDRNPQYVLESSGAIRNGYTVKILNMRAEPRDFVISIDGLPEASMALATDPLPKGGTFQVAVEPDTVHKLKVFVTVPRDHLPPGSKEFSFRVDYPPTGESAHYTATFHVPEKRK